MSEEEIKNTDPKRLIEGSDTLNHMQKCYENGKAASSPIEEELNQMLGELKEHPKSARFSKIGREFKDYQHENINENTTKYIADSITYIKKYKQILKGTKKTTNCTHTHNHTHTHTHTPARRTFRSRLCVCVCTFFFVIFLYKCVFFCTFTIFL